MLLPSKSTTCQLLLSLCILPCVVWADDDKLNFYNLTDVKYLLSHNEQEVTAAGKISPTNQTLSARLIQQGFTVEAVDALTLKLDEPIAWGHATIYKRAQEFYDEYTLATDAENAPSLAFSGAIEHWELGRSLTSATLVKKEMLSPSPALYATEYQLFGTHFSVQALASQECTEPNNYPAGISVDLSLHINGQTLALANGFDDDVYIEQDSEGKKLLSCNEFLTKTLAAGDYASVSFVGDLNGDHLLDLIVSSKQKMCGDLALFLGSETNGKFKLQPVASYGACGC